MNQFILTKPELCIGCKTCEIACVMAHAHDMDSLGGKNFHPRLQIIKQGDVTAAIACRHCADAPCAQACPNEAISHIRGSVQINQKKCIGCSKCVLACPYGVMSVITHATQRVVAGQQLGVINKGEAHKCDLCLDRAKGPACIESCPTKSLYLGALTE